MNHQDNLSNPVDPHPPGGKFVEYFVDNLNLGVVIASSQCSQLWQASLLGPSEIKFQVLIQ